MATNPYGLDYLSLKPQFLLYWASTFVSLTELCRDTSRCVGPLPVLVGTAAGRAMQEQEGSPH